MGKDDSDLGKLLSEMGLLAIPKNTPKDKLFNLLKPFLDGLRNEPELTREAWLGQVEERFNLTKEEAKALRNDLKSLRNIPSNQNATPIANGPVIVDVVRNNEGKPAFLTLDGEITRSLHVEGVNCCPPDKEALPFLLPKGKAVLKALEKDTDGQLYQDIRAYIYSASDLPNDKWYDLLAAWVFHTYLIEQAQYSPYIWFYAVPERGKSRTGKSLIYLAYRGLYTETLREAYLTRIAQNLNASLFLDVSELWKKAEKHGSEDILLNRYERGNRVPRVMYPDKGAFQDTVYFSIFGATLIATNETIPPALDSRAIQINMQPATRNFRNDITPELALPLKERLVAFRYRHMKTMLPDAEQPSRSRLGNILKPLAQVITLVQPDRIPVFLELVKEIEERRGIDRGETIEAKIVKAVVDLEDEVYQGRLLVKAIVKTYNKDIPEKWQVGACSIGKHLVALGFQKTKAGAGSDRAIYYDPVLIEKLSYAYLGKTSVMSEMPKVPSDVGLRADISTDVSDNTQKTSGQTSGGKGSNHAGYGITDVSDIFPGGVQVGCQTYQKTGRCPGADWVENELSQIDDAVYVSL